MTIRKTSLVATCAALLLAVTLAACEKKGPAETAGEKIDNAAERAGEQIEKAGEKIQDKANGDN